MKLSKGERKLFKTTIEAIAPAVVKDTGLSDPKQLGKKIAKIGFAVVQECREFATNTVTIREGFPQAVFREPNGRFKAKWA